MMTATRIRKNLNSIQAHCNVRTIRSKQLLTSLGTDTSIRSAYHRIAERHCCLAGDLSDHPWEVIIFDIAGALPGSKVPQLAVVSIVGAPNLGTDEEDFLVKNDDAAVVADIFVRYGPKLVRTEQDKGILG